MMKQDADWPGDMGEAMVLGMMHERFVHMLTPKGWYLDPSTFKHLQPASHQAPSINLPRFSAQLLSDAISRGWEHLWDDVQDLATTEGYFQPRTSTQPGYDSYINCKDYTIIIQDTRNPDHKVHSEGIESLLLRVPEDRPVCILFTLLPHPPTLAQQFRYQSWTREILVGRKPKARRGQTVEKEVWARGKIGPDELPARLHAVEQWAVPYPVLQPHGTTSTGSSAAPPQPMGQQQQQHSTTGASTASGRGSRRADGKKGGGRKGAGRGSMKRGGGSSSRSKNE